MQPASRVLPPVLYKALTKRKPGPQKAPTKQLVSRRLDPDVLAQFRGTGPGWQSRINAVLRENMPT